MTLFLLSSIWFNESLDIWKSKSILLYCACDVEDYEGGWLSCLMEVRNIYVQEMKKIDLLVIPI